jgi:hypothetical protein
MRAIDDQWVKVEKREEKRSKNWGIRKKENPGNAPLYGRSTT